MTDLVKSLKIGNNSYSIRDKNTYRSLSAAQESTLLSTGKYEGEDVENNTIFEAETGVSKKFTDTISGININWSSHTSTPVSIASLVYANGVWAGMQNSGTPVYSTNNGSSWQSGIITDGSSSLKCLDMAYGNGVFVTCGQYNGAVSSDGINWRANGNTGPDLDSIAFGNGKFLAVVGSSSSNRLYSSTDGLAWSYKTLPVSQQWSCIRYAEGHWIIASGSSNKCLLSSDGVTWTQSTTNINAAGHASLAYGNGVWICAPSSRDWCYRSTDNGQTWTSVSLPYTSNYWVSVAYGEGVFVASSSGGSLAYSVDGITWTSSVSGVANWKKDIAYGNGRFIYYSTYSSGVYYSTSIAKTHTYATTPLTYTATEVDTALSSKQGTLTAGAGIDITGDIISNTGLVNPAQRPDTNVSILGYPYTGTGSGNINIGPFAGVSSQQGGIAIGQSTVASATNAIALGRLSQATGMNAMALGLNAKATASQAIQIGSGTNSTEKTLQVSFQTEGVSSNYRLLDATGHIPVERLGGDSTATASNKFLRGDGTWAEAGSSLTAGSNITIDNGVISSKNTTYMAGTGIEMNTSKAYTVVGSPTIVDGVASNFSSSDYLTKILSWDHTKAWELVVPFMDKDLAVDSTSGVLHFTNGTDVSNYGFRFQTSYSPVSGTNSARAYFRVYDNTNTVIGQAILDGELQSNVQYYIKITYSPTTGYSLSVSTNETDWTTIGTIDSTTPMNSGASKLWMGVRSDQSYPLTNGAIDLKKMYLKAEGSPIWTPAGTVINNTGLVNNSESIQDALAVGPHARALNGGALAIGSESYSGGYDTIAIGSDSQAYGYDALAVGTSSQANENCSVAIGPGALSDAEGAIQLGAGENTTAYSLQFGEYPLFDGSGNLYKERIQNIIEPVQSLPTTPVEGKIYLILGA